MKDILTKLSKYGLPSDFFGVTSMSSSASRDLFYLLALSTPLMAKNRSNAFKLLKETFELGISDTDIKSKLFSH